MNYYSYQCAKHDAGITGHASILITVWKCIFLRLQEHLNTVLLCHHIYPGATKTRLYYSCCFLYQKPNRAENYFTWFLENACTLTFESKYLSQSQCIFQNQSQFGIPLTYFFYLFASTRFISHCYYIFAIWLANAAVILRYIAGTMFYCGDTANQFKTSIILSNC